MMKFVQKYLPLLALGLVLALALSGPAFAQSVTIDAGDEGTLTNRVLQLIALLTVLSLAPSIIIMTTSFVRIVVVLSLLRTATGLQQAPPNMVIISLALFLTAFIMAPVFQKSYAEGIEPLMNQEMELGEAFTKSTSPIKSFMVAQTGDDDLALFYNLAKKTRPQNADDIPLHIVAPAFMISELRRAFLIGFMYFIPFLIIDLVVASILMSMGMMMLPPVVISLPFKLIFFVQVDGWRLVVGSLIESFNQVS